MMDIQRQLRSVIEWKNPSPEVLFIRWSESGDEIKHASKLIVGPGQGCIFVYEGKVSAVYLNEGVVSLATENLPFWTTVKKALQNFESEHKVGIYYFRKAEVVNIRWGTPAPIKYLDPIYKFPVGLGAYGNYSLRILQPADFLRNIIAGSDLYEVGDLQLVILSRITSVVTDQLGKSKYSYLDVDGQRSEISQAVTQNVRPIFRDLGFELTDFRIEGTSFDAETQARIGRIADLSAEAQAAAAAGIDYVKLQQLQAMKDAAKNPTSIAGTAISLSAGAGLAQLFGDALAPPRPPVAGGGDELTAKLQRLKSLFDGGLITDEEHKERKKALLDSM